MKKIQLLIIYILVLSSFSFSQNQKNIEKTIYNKVEKVKKFRSLIAAKNIKDEKYFATIRENAHTKSGIINVVDYVTGTDIYGMEFRETYDYDQNGNRILVLEQKSDGTNLINNRRTSYSYNNFGDETLRLREIWDGSMWVGNTRNSTTYDLMGNELVELDEMWNGSEWIGVTRYSYEYDSEGFETLAMKETWDGSSWTNEWRETYTDVYSTSFSILHEMWNGSEWVNEWKENYTENGNESISYDHANWDGENWINDYKLTTIFGDNNRISSQLEEVWDGSSWVNDSRTTIEYSENGSYSFIMMENWVNEMWENDSRISYTYNGLGQQLTFTSENWNGSDWVPEYRTSNTYDSNGNRVENKNEEWDGTQLVNSNRVVFTFDSDNNLITGKAEVWENSSWNESPGYISFRIGDFETMNYSFSFLAHNIEVFYKQITDVNNDSQNYNEFQISQNYPNPFNPTTTIDYTIPSSSVITSSVKQSSEITSANSFPRNDNVNLTVYDILGREVSTLVNQKQNHGNYSVQFNASDLASGIYYYKLQVGSFVQTKKMIVLK